MRIERVEAIPLEVPLLKPLKMAVATVTVRTCVIVRITTDDGRTGIGDSVLARYFTGESLASAADLINTAFAEALAGRDPCELGELRSLMRKITVNNTGARAAVEMALHDLAAQQAGVPLYEFFGGRKRDSVPTIWHVSGGSVEDKAADAATAVADGYPLIKLKVGGDIDNDIAATHAVRAAIGDGVKLLTDANQGWTVDGALRYAHGVEACQLGFIEQPVNHRDIRGMAQLVAQSPVPIAGDEAIFDATDLDNYLAFGATSAAVLKLMKAAGPIGVREAAAVADRAGIPIHFAGMAGQTSVSTAHGAHLALALPTLEHGAGMSPQLLADDICVERMMPDKGHFYPTDEPGVGVTIDEDKLSFYRADK